MVSTCAIPARNLKMTHNRQPDTIRQALFNLT